MAAGVCVAMCLQENSSRLIVAVACSADLWESLPWRDHCFGHILPM